MAAITGRARTMMRIGENAILDGDEWAHAANPEDKRALVSLERRGLVQIRRTRQRVAGLQEWWFKLTPDGRRAMGLGERDRSRPTRRQRRPIRSRRDQEIIASAELYDRHGNPIESAPFYEIRGHIRPERDRSKPSRRQEQFIGEKIRVLRHEGYPENQAIAIAYRMAGVPPRSARRRDPARRTTRTRGRSAALERFVRGYADAALFASTDDDGEPLDRNYSTRDLAPETRRIMLLDATNFFTRHVRGREATAGREEEAGNDFWLTREGHGAGFWDGDWPEPDASELTRAAKAFGEAYLYVGDDGRIYQGTPSRRRSLRDRRRRR